MVRAGWGCSWQQTQAVTWDLDQAVIAGPPPEVGSQGQPLPPLQGLEPQNPPAHPLTEPLPLD